MTQGYIKTRLGILRIIVILGILGSIALLVATDGTIPYHLLTTSVVLVFLALVNLADNRTRRDAEWAKYTTFLFFGMLLGSIGDFLMAGVFYITPEPLVNGVLAFGIGHVFYLMALRDRSPLQPDRYRHELRSVGLRYPASHSCSHVPDKVVRGFPESIRIVLFLRPATVLHFRLDTRNKGPERSSIPQRHHCGSNLSFGSVDDSLDPLDFFGPVLAALC